MRLVSNWRESKTDYTHRLTQRLLPGIGKVASSPPESHYGLTELIIVSGMFSSM